MNDCLRTRIREDRVVKLTGKTLEEVFGPINPKYLIRAAHCAWTQAP